MLLASHAQRILSRSLMKLEANDVSFFPVSPAMSLSEDRSCVAYKTMAANETELSHAMTSLHDIGFLSPIPLTNT